jgi:hypothetical protein
MIPAKVGRPRSAVANSSNRHRSEVGLPPDGKRLHLHDGPIDLIVEADGSKEAVREAYIEFGSHLIAPNASLPSQDTSR